MMLSVTQAICTCTRSDNLILGMAASCRWGVESGKLMYPSTFGHVPTCVYMSRNRGSSTCPWYTVGGKMSDKNLE
jgi:hypothetical protein